MLFLDVGLEVLHAIRAGHSALLGSKQKSF